MLGNRFPLNSLLWLLQGHVGCGRSVMVSPQVTLDIIFIEYNTWAGFSSPEEAQVTSSAKEEQVAGHILKVTKISGMTHSKLPQKTQNLSQNAKILLGSCGSTASHGHKGLPKSKFEFTVHNSLGVVSGSLLIATFFADDTTAYLSKEDDFGKLQAILDEWCLASGAQFNISKMEVIPIGSPEYHNMIQQQHFLNGIDGTAIPEQTTPWTRVIDKINSALARWEQSKPTMEGHHLIINMVIGGMTQYLTKVQENGGRKVLDLLARNEAIMVTWLQSYLDFSPERATWAYVADALIAHHVPASEANIKDHRKINIFLQS
ncbi:hypothetical protein BT96DRAFT_940358 [Gymnopus androsaceus JB14]|uniref:Reverse transcriptase domain-containing protein n=1 Tax=Gymnopus androsaceus JB14 TaxID=1447944 RepID=A0A6A4HKK5_9AGAR|nr:hypothetical protein BT96DRAFT_940358 [Gymnopus androsaceus JB14]